MTFRSNADSEPAKGAVACLVCDFENAKLVSRAKWCCPKCGRDFSLEYLFWAEAAHPEWLEDVPNIES